MRCLVVLTVRYVVDRGLYQDLRSYSRCCISQNKAYGILGNDPQYSSHKLYISLEFLGALYFEELSNVSQWLDMRQINR